VEKKAVARAKERIASADIVIAVFDGSRGLDRQDLALMRRLPRTKKTIAVINKADLKRRVDTERIAKRFGRPVELSAKKRENIAALEEAVAAAAGCTGESGEVMVSNLRHIQQLKKVKKIVEDTLNYRDNEVPPECAAQNLRDACASLDRLQGRDFSEDLLERIFSRFCIGK
jgi:tRNA modification GTPase